MNTRRDRHGTHALRRSLMSSRTSRQAASSSRPWCRWSLIGLIVGTSGRSSSHLRPAVRLVAI